MSTVHASGHRFTDSTTHSMSMRMRAEVEETVEAVLVVGMEALDQGAVVGPVGRVVVEVEAAVALPTTRQRFLRHH
jgi:hypothetical protein